MKTKRITKIALIFVLLLSILATYTPKTEAATYTATVNTKSLNVMKKPSTKAAKIGTLKKGTKVTVYAKNKSGWSEIRYKSKKSYVLTEYLKFNTSGDIIVISSGAEHHVVLKKDGTVWTWGINNLGQLGNGTTSFNYTAIPKQIKGLTDVIAVGAGAYYTAALKKDGTVWIWGGYQVVPSGNGAFYDTDITSPIQVPGLTDVTAISAGAWHTMALKKDGTVWVWGNNNRGEYGNGTYKDSNEPVQMQGLTDVIAIEAGPQVSFAVKRDGTVWGSGNGSFGELGETANGFNNNPLQVKGLTDVQALVNDGGTTYTLKKDGTVWALGLNDLGQLGELSIEENERKPVPIKGLNNVVSISAGGSHAIALREDGTIWTWGGNYDGQLGDGTSENRKVPVQVHDLNDVKVIFATASTSYAIKKDDTAWVWGHDKQEFGISGWDISPHKIIWENIGENMSE